jgi:drug/metabolite transporter (DMT)-like permease
MVARVMKKVAHGERWTWGIAPRRIARALTQGGLWLGIGFMTLAFFSFIMLLSWADVSFAVPATAANYAVGALGAKVLLKEQVSRTRWAGVLLVAAGVVLVCSAS